MNPDTINPMSDKEIEIQVKIENSAKLLDFLNSSARFQYENHQIDTYYCPAHRDFLSVRPVDEWLRLRDSNGKYLITYKKWQHNTQGVSIYSDEYETPVENLDQLQKIFEVLDFKPITVVDKIRKAWRYNDYEIAIDKVKNLGDFVEIEYKGGDTSLTPEQITDQMIGFLKNLNVGRIERNHVGYPFMLLFKEEVKQVIQ